MKIKLNKLLIKMATLLVAGFPVISTAQTTGTLGTESVVVQREYEPTITDAEKISENPKMFDSVPVAPKLKYGITSKRYDTPFEVEPITPATIKGEPLVKLYRHYAKVGFGNYQTPLLEYSFNTLRNKNYAVGGYASHFSSQGQLKDVSFSGFSENRLGVFGKYISENHIVSPELNFSNNVVHFYGLNPVFADQAIEKSSIRQRFTFIEPKVLVKSNYKDTMKLSHQVMFKYHNINDLYLANENFIATNIKLEKYVNTELFGGEVTFNYFQNKNSVEKTDGIILGLNPYAALQKSRFTARLGAKFFIESDETSSYHFYPDVNVKYEMFEEIMSVYASVTGLSYRNTYKMITDQNPFVQSASELRNSREKVNLQGGFIGRISSRMSYDLRGGYKKVDQMPLFVNYNSNFIQNKFNIIYDNLEVISATAEIRHQQNEKLSIGAKGTFSDYKTEFEDQPWNLPNLEVSLDARYNIADKIIARTDLFYIGDRFVKNIHGEFNVLPVSMKLKSIIDANIGLEYRYTKRMGVFINFNNLAASRYYRYNNYPSQRFNFIGGLNYIF